jgi:P27 family predicted phage terminase small subunit
MVQEGGKTWVVLFSKTQLKGILVAMSNPRKPAAIRRAEGNRGHRPIPDEVIGLGTPEPPPKLTPSQRERWDDIVHSMPDGYLTAADVSTIERMAVAWATFRETTLALNDKTLVRGRDGNVVRNPLLMVRKQAAEEMHLCGLALGLSPYARTRLTAQTKDEDDLLSALMAGPATIRNH